MSVGKGVDWVVDTAIIELAALVRLAAKIGDRVLNRAIPMDEAAAQRTLAAHRLVEAEAEVDSLEPQFDLDTQTGRINYATYQNLKAAQPENPLYAALVDEYLGHQTSAPAHSPEQVAAGRPESEGRPPSASDSGHPTTRSTSDLLTEAAFQFEMWRENAFTKDEQLKRLSTELIPELRDRAAQFSAHGD